MPPLKEKNYRLTVGSNPLTAQVFDFINTNFRDSITLKDVAAAVNYSPSYLTNLIKCQTGKTVNRWIVERRMVEARSLLLKTDRTAKRIAYDVGYLDVNYFFRQFRQYHEITPQVWRKLQLTCSSTKINKTF